jgi:sugar phosphate isomerase/epimerase
MDLERISACTYALREQDLDTTFTVIADGGCRKVDLWGGLPNYSNDPAECDVPALKAKAAQYGLAIANLGTYPGRKIAEVGYEAEMLEMTRAIDNAAFLGARSIRVCPGHGEDPGIVDEVIPFFRQAAGHAAEKGVYLGMENHKGSIARDPDLVMRLVRAVDSPFFGILYEPANLMACDVDYKDAFEFFRGWITHVHVKDSHWTDEGYARTMFGEGDIDWAWCVSALDASGYAGDYALEYEVEKILPMAEGFPLWMKRFLEL